MLLLLSAAAAANVAVVVSSHSFTNTTTETWVTVGYPRLCCCVCATSFQRGFTPLFLDSAHALWASSILFPTFAITVTITSVVSVFSGWFATARVFFTGGLVCYLTACVLATVQLCAPSLSYSRWSRLQEAVTVAAGSYRYSLMKSTEHIITLKTKSLNIFV